MVSCSKNPGENFGTLINSDGSTATFAIANNGGNITCDEVATQVGCGFEFTSGKIDYYGGGGGTIDDIITWTTDGTAVNWTSTVPVKIAVIVKGGPNASVYFSGCDECVSSGTGLTAPLAPSGKPYGLSNITFCYSVCESVTIIAVKTFTNDGGWAMTTTATTRIGSWCSQLESFSFPQTNTFDLRDGYNLSQSVGGVSVFNNNDGTITITVAVNSPLLMTKTYVYVGTAEDLWDSSNLDPADGCPDYDVKWPYSNTELASSPRTFTVPFP